MSLKQATVWVSIIFLIIAACNSNKIQVSGLEQNSDSVMTISGNDSVLFTNNEPLLDLAPKEDDEKEKEDKKDKKKWKKRVFYGLKTRKQHTIKEVGRRVTRELFFVLKDYKKPNPYVEDIHWYDPETEEVKSRPINRREEAARAQILHGPYKKKINGEVVKSGIFYKGMKHGRWVKYNYQKELVEKEKWNKGWPKYADISYYDASQQKIKEVMPYKYEEHGELTGDYYYFYENGNKKIEGQYKYGTKIGVWKYYYASKRRWKQVKYPKDPFAKDTAGTVIRKWNKKGNMVYDQRDENQKGKDSDKKYRPGSRR